MSFKAIADSRLDIDDGDICGCTLTTILCSSLPWDDPVYWADASSVKDAVERLSEVSEDCLKPLDEVKEQLAANPSRHEEFLHFQGVNELWRLLMNGNSIIQRKCLRVIEILAISEGPQKYLREIGMGDTLLQLIKASSKKMKSTRRYKAGQILKLIAGNSHSSRLFGEISKKQTSRNSKVSAGTHGRVQTPPSTSSSNHFAKDITRERPLPLWYHSTYPNLPWDSETVSCLVDLLLSNAVEESHRCCYRVIKKILDYGQLSQHVIIGSQDVAALIKIIASMHSTSVLAIKAVTCASIMHSANGQNFIQLGGLEALVNAIRSDNIGSICGELAAWSLSHFCETSTGSAEEVVRVGGTEALTELSHSFDYCSREAAVHAMVSMLKKSDRDRKMVIEKLGESGIVPSLLDILKDGQDHPRRHAVINDSFKALLEMAKVQVYRKQILEKGDGIALIQQCTVHCGRAVEETSKQLQKWLSSPSQRFRRALRSSNKKEKNIGTRIVKKLKKLFKSDKHIPPSSSSSTVETRPHSIEHVLASGGLDRADELRSISKTEPRVTHSRSISTFSSSVQSDFHDGLLATAPGGTRTPASEFLNDEDSPTFQTLSVQQFTTTDKDFDPSMFGGRASKLAFVSEENRNEFTFSTYTEDRDDGDGGGVNEKKHSGTHTGTTSELIRTHDFI